MPTTNVYTDKQLIEAGRQFAATHGDLRQVDWSAAETIASRSTICLRFGSWENFRKRCGVKDASPTRADLVKAGRKLAQNNGGQLRVSMWDRVRPLGVGRSYVIARFGSWGEFRSACNISDGTVSNAQLVAWGAKISVKSGRRITIADVNGAQDRPCTSQTIFNRFGSFSAYADQVELVTARVQREKRLRQQRKAA